MSDKNPNSNAAKLMRESRARKKNKLIDEEMNNNPKLSREQATKIVTDKIRKKNSQDRQQLRMKKSGRTIVKIPPDQEERKEEYKNLYIYYTIESCYIA